MPRPARPWFRFYVEGVHDRKLRRLTPAQRWLWVAVLAAARQSPMPGWLWISDRDSMTDVDLADFAAMPLRQVKDGLAAMDELGLIERDEDTDSWRVPKWNDRQYESDDVTARTRAHRDRKERSNNVPGTAVGTPPETETDTDPLSPPTDIVTGPDDYRLDEQAQKTSLEGVRTARAAITPPSNVIELNATCRPSLTATETQ